MIYADQFVLFGSNATPLYLVGLEVAEVQADGSIDIRLSADTLSSTYRLSIANDLPAGYSHMKVSGPDVSFRRSNGVVLPLEEHLASTRSS